MDEVTEDSRRLEGPALLLTDHDFQDCKVINGLPFYKRTPILTKEALVPCCHSPTETNKGVVAHCINPSTRKTGRSCEFKASVVYRVNSKTARAT